MLQIRPKGAEGDRRWYSPERDICYAFPRTLRKSLESFNNFKDNNEVTLEELGQACKVLGRIVQGCREGGLKPVDALQLLLSITKPALGMIGTNFLFTFFGELLVWCSEVRPKDHHDVPIDTADLEKILAQFAAGAANVSGNDDEKTA